ncbi:MAG: cadherin domain-containing protein [Burkholderiaceae bacterium]
METLAPRILYSADAAMLVAPVADGIAGADQWHQSAATVEQTQADQTSPQIAQHQQASSLVVIDDSIDDIDTLVSFLSAEQRRGVDVDWLLIDQQTDGIGAVADALQDADRPYDAVHVFSHGSEASLSLGSAQVNEQSFEHHEQSLAGWAPGLTKDADILLYACDFSANEQGKALAENLAAASGADIATSNDTTGHTVLGGDWQLEDSTGTIEASALVTPQLSANWLTTLAVTPTTVELPVTVDTAQDDRLTLDFSSRQVATNGTMTVIVWERQDEIFFRRFQIDGTALDASDIQIQNTLSVKHEEPTVAMASNGDFMIVWKSDDGAGGSGVNGQVFNADGTSKARPADAPADPYTNPSEFRINNTTPGDQERPAIAVRSDDTFLVSWQGPFTVLSTTSDGVAYTLHDLDGSRIRNEAVASLGVSTDEVRPAVASNPIDNTMIIAFQQNGTDDRIQLRRLQSDGDLVLPVADVEVPGRNLNDPSIAFANDGRYYLTAKADNDDILLWAFAADNTLITATPVQVNEVSGGKLSNAEVAVAANGSVVVVWDHEQGPQNDEISIRQFDANGNPITAETYVNIDTDKHQHRPSLAIAGNTALVIWGGDTVTDNQDVTLRLLSVEVPAIRVTPSGNTTTEAGGTVTLAVRLDTKPAGIVALGFTSSDGSEGSVSTNLLSFTAANWDTEQFVTVTGLSDLIADGDVSYNVTITATSSDSDYNTLADTIITLTNTDVNAVGAVSDSNAATNEVAENSPAGTLVGITGFADDPDAGDNVSYSLTGPGSAFFDINPTSGVVTTSATPLDFETNTAQSITVVATSDDTSTSQLGMSVTVLNQNDNAPVIGAGQSLSIDENSANTSVVGTPAVSDADGVTTFQNWTITGGTGAAVFNINAGTGQITVADSTALNFEANPSFTLTLTVSDGVNTSAAENVTINLNNLNEAPAGGDAVSSGPEDDDIMLTSAEFVFNDPDTGDTLQGIDIRTLPGVGSLFLNGTVLNGSTVLPSFVSTADLDLGRLIYRPPANANGASLTSFEIAVVDQAGERSVTRTQTIDILAVDDPPIITSFGGNAAVAIDVAENSTGVGTVIANDAEGELMQYTGSGDDAAFFDVDANSGLVRFLAAPDFETPQSNSGNNAYEITVTATDPGGNTDTQALTVNVTDQNDIAPVITPGQSFNVAENAPNGTTVNVPVATDADGPGTFNNWTITGGTGATAFSINPASGMISVSNSGLLNFESTPSLTLDTTVSDGINISAAETVTINLTDLNESPTGANATSNGQEDTDLALTSAQFTFNDPDNGDTMSGIDIRTLPAVGSLILNGFALNGSTPLPSFVSTADLDSNSLLYRPPAELSGAGLTSFEIAVVDLVGERATPVTQTINVAAIDDPPIITSFGGNATVSVDVAENTSGVGRVLASDAESELMQFFGSGDDAVFFDVDVNTGVVSFIAAPDFETPQDNDGNNTYELTVTASDPGGNTDVQALTVNVTNANDLAPVITAGQRLTVSENALNGASVGTPLVSDPDGFGITSNWTITGGTGSLAFSIDPASGLISVDNASLLDFESNPTLTLDITVSDGTNTATAVTVLVDITGANETPQTANGAISVDEDTAYSFALSDFAFSDPDSGDALSALRVISLPAQGELQVNGISLVNPSLPVDVSRGEILAGNFIYRPPPDAAGTPLTSFSFAVRDGAGAQSATASQTLNVVAVNDPPTVSGTQQATVPAGGTVVFDSALLATRDVEDGATALTYTVQTNPTLGVLTVDGAAVSPGDRFTQADIESGRVRYASLAAGDSIDSLTLSVSDSNGASIGDVTVSITALGAPVTTAPPPDRAPSLPSDTDDQTESTTDETSSGEEEEQAQSANVQVSPPPLFNATAGSAAQSALLSTDEQGSLAQVVSSQAQRDLLLAGRWLASGHYGSDLASQLNTESLEIFGLSGDAAGSDYERMRSEMLVSDFDRMRDLLNNEFSRQLQFDQTVVASSVAVSTSLSIGYVLWLLRSGALLSSVLASIPAWRVIDPLPILASMPTRADDQKDESLEQMVDKPTANDSQADQDGGNEKDEGSPPSP